MVKNNGCAFGQVSRTMIVDIKDDVKEISSKIDCIDQKMTELYNHQSSRLPLWATILFSTFSALIVGLIVWAVTH